MASIDLGLSLATGSKWLGLIGTPADGVDVLYVQTEIPQPMLQGRAKIMASNYDLKLRTNSAGIWKPGDHLFFLTEHFLKLDNANGYSQVLKAVQNLRPKVVILDPLYKMLSGDLLKADVATPFLDSLDQLIAKTNIALVIIAHPRKGEADETGADDMLGSSLFPDWADTVIRASRTGGGKEWDNVRLDFLKTRHATELIEPVEATVNRRSLVISASPATASIQQPKGSKK